MLAIQTTVKWIMVVALSIILMVVLSAQPLLAAGPATQAQGQPQRIIIGLRDAQNSDWLRSMSARQGWQIVQVNEKLGYAVVLVPPTSDNRIQAQLTELPDVRYVEPDTRVSIAASPNDPAYNDPSLVYGPQMMKAPTAWDSSMGDSNIIIGILDTGVDTAHPEFSGRILPGYDFVNNDSDPADDHGHGTHVAGIAAAGINNGIGIAGIAGQASILPVKVLDNTGNGWWSNVATGMTWAVDHGARVINLSLGGTVDSQVMRDAVAYATAHDTVVVVAAGNSATDTPFYPAVYDNVLAVGAMTPFGERASFSNYGPNVDVMAPGSTIYSTAWSGTGQSYEFRSGTSMASPHVAGLAALMLSVNPTLSESDVRNLIMNNTQAADPQVVDYYLGHGLVDAGAAVAAAAAQAQPGPTASIGGIAFYDWNQNGVKDLNEQPTPNVQVCLYQDQGSLGVLDAGDVQISCQNTPADGSYLFTSVADGNYLVIEQAPSQYLITTAMMYSVSVVNGTANATASSLDFGYLVYSTLSGTLYIDSNGNGIHDPSENTGIANAVVTLTNIDTSESFSTFSDSNGLYSFDSLIPGTYSLKAPAYVPGYTPTGSTTKEVTIDIDTSVSGQDFGYINPTGVQLVNFTSSWDADGVHIRWTTSSEQNQSGYVIWRSFSADGTYKPVSPLILAENDAQGASYEWTDKNVDQGTYWYKLQSMPDGTFYGPIASSLPSPQPDTIVNVFAPLILR